MSFNCQYRWLKLYYIVLQNTKTELLGLFMIHLLCFLIDLYRDVIECDASGPGRANHPSEGKVKCVVPSSESLLM